ncbi:carbon storage regulator [Adhaeretor mobilis]|uniref:Translational regulator CsrA n=1 Tax=Adhaeretor mobilis TaxID=1930276 RepID=A0A517N0U0_9BACT|nr:carbon storage regulator [Adhaeretor mobilis]QDT00746.1 hypothetical protein HG15A2_40860 [Adhaeretor mobilis]
MLVLSRKCSERIVIDFNGETIIVHVLKMQGKQVRLGIEAPVHIAVHRQEISDKLAAERVA